MPPPTPASASPSSTPLPNSAQTAPRVTVIGDLAPVPRDEDAAARALYLEQQPEAKDYSQFGDFALHRLTVRDIYFVGGFGRAGWVSRAE